MAPDAPLPPFDDRAVAARLRQGDRGAFDALFREYYAALVGVADVVVRERGVAEEIVQDVMLELWRRHDAITIDQSLKGYLIGATRNRALNFVRHAAVQKKHAPFITNEMSSPPAADQELVASELGAAITAAIASLPPRCREVFELSRLRGLKQAEVAEALGISVKTVEAQMGKALRVLRERLAEWT